MIPTTQRITAQQFLVFNDHLLGLVRARVPLDQGLRRMAEEMKPGLNAPSRFRGFIDRVAGELERGSQLSQALESAQVTLPDYYIALVRAGEAGGSLAEILHHVVTETQRRISHRRAVTSALIYPAVVLIFAVTIFSFILWVIVPHFVDIFLELGAELPLPTLMLVNLATGVGAWWPYLLALMVLLPVLAFGSKWIGRTFRDALLLNLPVVGRLVYDDTIVTFTRSLAFMLARRVPLPDALTLTQSVLENRLARQFVGDVRGEVERGRSLSEALDASNFLAPSTRWMIRLSEQRGDLDATLSEIADYYQDRVQTYRRSIQGLLEPVIITGMGIIIGIMIISLYLPLFYIPKVIR